MIAIYPGTFDPITKGHLNLIQRSSKMFDVLYVAIAMNSDKISMFTLEDRLEMARDATTGINGVKIVSCSGLLVDFAKHVSAEVIIRGLRAVSDFEYEFQMSCMNYHLKPEIETIFLPAQDDMHFISSRFVKAVASLGGDVSKFVPPCVVEKIASIR